MIAMMVFCLDAQNGWRSQMYSELKKVFIYLYSGRRIQPTVGLLSYPPVIPIFSSHGHTVSNDEARHLGLEVASVTALLARGRRRGASRRSSSSSRGGGAGAGGNDSGRRGAGGRGGDNGSRGRRSSSRARARGRSSSSSSGSGSGARARDTSQLGSRAGSDGDGGLDQVGALGDLGRAGDVVGGEGLVDVDEDTRVGLSVQGLAQGAGGGDSAGARDGQVEALGVVLGTVRVLSRVQSNNLVAPDVVAGGQVLGDLDDPRVVVGDELRRAPSAGQGGVVDEADGGNLEELKGRLVDSGAVSVAACQHVDDWANVGIRPGSPVGLDRVTGSDCSVTASVGGIDVADDVS